jgi:hypothetical protein
MNKRQLFYVLAFIFILASCVVKTRTVKTTTLPPGQAKKITGSQSAAPYAPGQQKKKGKTVVVVTNNR